MNETEHSAPSVRSYALSRLRAVNGLFEQYIYMVMLPPGFFEVFYC
jgi:hypothetical protein